MTTNTMGRDEAGKAIRKRAMEGCPLARELLILRGMCSCQGDEKSVDDAEDRYLELAVLRDAVPALQAEVEALRAERDALRERQSTHSLSALEAELASLRTDRDGAAEACRMLQEDKARLEQDNARLRGLLGAARCPNCDGSGAIPHGPTPDGDWEAEQCQWCYEKQEALAAGGDQ